MAKVDRILDNIQSSGSVNMIHRPNRFRSPGRTSYPRSNFYSPRNQGRSRSPYYPRRSQYGRGNQRSVTFAALPRNNSRNGFRDRSYHSSGRNRSHTPPRVEVSRSNNFQRNRIRTPSREPATSRSNNNNFQRRRNVNSISVNLSAGLSRFPTSLHSCADKHPLSNFSRNFE